MPQETPTALTSARRKPAALDTAKLNAIRAPATGRVDYPDGKCAGLSLRVPAKGDWVWTLRMRDADGALRRFVLGTRADERGLRWARDAAEKMRHDVRRNGKDPHRERRERVEAASLTVKALVEAWKTIRLGDRKPRYAAEAERALAHAFKTAWERPANALTAGDVRKWSDATNKAGQKAMASAVIRYGRAAFNWAVKREMIKGNPFAGQDAPVVEARDRVLTDDELSFVLKGASKIGGTYGSVVQILALTGQRLNEVAGMDWLELSLDMTTWTIPGARTKNGRTHVVPLSAAVRAWLPSTRAKGLVLPGERPGAGYAAWSRAKTRLDSYIEEDRVKAGLDSETMPGWRLHDLRRTAATGFQRLGVRLEVTEAVLNHVSGSRAGIVGVYQRHDWADEKRIALQAWAMHVERLVSDPAPPTS